MSINIINHHYHQQAHKTQHPYTVYHSYAFRQCEKFIPEYVDAGLISESFRE